MQASENSIAVLGYYRFMNTQHSGGELQKLHDVLKGFDTAMLISRSTAAGMHGRPMAIAELGDDAHLYFVTDKSSAKAHEIGANDVVVVTCQEGHNFASLTGTVTIEDDRARVDSLWKEAWKVWFPEGKSDPNICLLRFQPRQAEYWDNSGLRGLKYLFEAAKAYLTHERPQSDRDQNAKLSL